MTIQSRLLCLIFTIGYFILPPGDLNAQAFVTSITSEQKENASAIVRQYDTKITIEDIGHAEIYQHYTLTVLNPQGDRYANFVEYYDKFSIIKNIDGVLYGPFGNKIKTLKNSDVSDLSATDDISLADDGRIKRHSFNHSQYPYTVEYESTIKMNGIFYFPTWNPIFATNISVEKSSLEVNCPKGYLLRYKQVNLDQKPEITSTDKNTVFKWQVENLPIQQTAAFSPSLAYYVPKVFLGPTTFEIQKYEGKMSSWKEFGLFQHELNKGRDELPEDIKQKVHSLVDGLQVTSDKIDVLYRYMQKNTRYVSVQLGIGGWQTFDAKYVAKNSYGDCKALTNYMYALLKEAGIKSIYTLVMAGDNSREVLKDFSSPQFNHVILCVPQAKDSIWLECTSQTLRMGYLSSFTSDRTVLLITENGGLLARTPTYTADVNLQLRQGKAVIDDKGNLKTTIATMYRAEKQDDIHGALTYSGTSYFKDYMQKKFSSTAGTVDSFNHSINILEKYPVVNEAIFITAINYATITGKRLFINPNVSNKSSIKFPIEVARKADYFFDKSFTDIDSIRFELPTGYVLESVPKNIKINCPIGYYETSYSYADNNILFVRKYQQQKLTLPASKGKELSEFFESIYQADRSRMVFVKRD